MTTDQIAAIEAVKLYFANVDRYEQIRSLFPTANEDYIQGKLQYHINGLTVFLSVLDGKKRTKYYEDAWYRYAHEAKRQALSMEEQVNADIG